MLGFAPLGALPIGGLEANASVNIDISVPLLTNVSTIYTPSIIVGIVISTVPVLTNVSTIYTPSIIVVTIVILVPKGSFVGYMESSHVLQYTEINYYVKSRSIIV